MESKIVLNKKNPHEKANVLSKLLLIYSFSLFRKGRKHGVTMSDLWPARKGDESGRLGDYLEQAWETELGNHRQFGIKPSLTKAIVRAFWLEYVVSGLLLAALLVIVFPLLPFTLAKYIEYFSHEKTPETYRVAHIFIFIMNCCSVISPIVYIHSVLTQNRVGMRVRIACCSLMYRKILKLNRDGLSKTEPGQVVNLMSNDVSRFDLVSGFLNNLWVVPIVVPVVTYLVWQHIGVATLAALLVIFLQTVFVQVYLSNIQGTYRGKIATRTDARVKVMSELVNGVQVIKMYAWEKPFEILVDKLRKLEVQFVMKTSAVKGFTTALALFTERFVLFVSIVTFVLMGGKIRAQIAYALAQYFNIIQLACNIHFPLALTFLAEARVSMKRIEDFLLLDEKDPKVLEPKMISEEKPLLSDIEDKKSDVQETKTSTLIIANVSASWIKDAVVDNLRNITLTAKPGELVGIAGSVGSGKSSLLQLILGELKPKQGTITLGSSTVSYASQEPWLFVATIRENILFGLPYDRLRYKRVVKACALLRDFELLPHGDSTLVSEKGLSGGQRARIGLARACYRQADLYLLDDPLSAVDTHVGKHLVTECIQGFLGHATRILVTHQLHHLREADKLIILRHGEIEIEGSFEEVSKTSLFTELLQDNNKDDGTGDQGQIERQLNTAKINENTPMIEREKIDDTQKNQEEDEEMSGSGRVSLSVYRKYFSAGSGYFLLSTMVLSILVAQVITSSSDLWLTYWINKVEEQYTFNNVLRKEIPELSNVTKPVSNMTEYTGTVSPVPTNITTASITAPPASNFTSGIITVEHEGINNMYYIYIWTGAIFACVVLTTGRSILFLWTCMRSSIKLHNKMFSNIMGATMRFFDTNPSGRILNRFSKDMGIVDEFLPRLALEALQIFMLMLGIIAMVAIVNPLMLVTTCVCGVAMYFWTSLYLIIAQDIKRLEGVTRSPVFSHVTATMSGLSTVRASDAQNMLIKQFDDKQDIHSAAWYLSLVGNNAYSLWLSFICATYVIVVGYSFLIWDNGASKSGNVGLAISQGLILVNMVQHGIKHATEVISQMISVERILQFTSLPQEKKIGSSPPDGWPQKGGVIIKDLSLRYTEMADPVLKNLNIEIKSGWKVGVVGRTGAGKSSLISALFRLAPVEGKIFIDDVDTGLLSLKLLRSKISIIPQVPVLFSASFRYNMDPFEEYSDVDIWNALEQVQLKDSVPSLSAAVEAGGSNLSAGQRQLLCLARAALARNSLLILDEATANVDPTTDAVIQKSIRKHFADCTVITVAHRLHTVADSDKVIVMEAGEIIESGHPHELLKHEEGHFSKMVKELGVASEHSLRELAGIAYSEHVVRNTDGPEIVHESLEKIKEI